MKILVCGSIAVDYLMHFPGYFRDSIMPDKLDCLSVSFLTDSLRRSYGGVGGNICYNLGLLGEKPVLVGAAGVDFSDYRKQLEAVGVDTSGVLVVDDAFTASFFVTSDDAGSQIASFYIGAMGYADRISLRDTGVKAGDIVIVSPDKPEAMLLHAKEAKEAGAKLIFDPSQQMPRLSGKDLAEAADGAFALTMNNYELAMFTEKTGLNEECLHKMVDLLVITEGVEGSRLCHQGQITRVACVPARTEVDPTGVGDAYRAGLIKGIVAGLSMEESGRLGSVTACYAVEHSGTQEHQFTKADFVQRYRDTFGDIYAVESIIGKPIAL